jgi:hypothetical protein
MNRITAPFTLLLCRMRDLGICKMLLHKRVAFSFDFSSQVIHTRGLTSCGTVQLSHKERDAPDITEA